MLKTFFIFCLLIGTSAASVALNVPVLYSPADKATKQSTGASLVVKAVSGATYYEIQYSESSSFTNFTKIKSYSNSTLGFFYTLPLKFNTTYYWRSRARTTADSSGWSAAWSFTTESSLVLYSPSDNYGPTTPGVFFSWYRCKEYANYVFQLDTSKNFNSKILVSRNISDTFSWFYVEIREASIKFRSTYYWRVKGVAGADSNAWTMTRKLITTDSLKIFSPASGTNSAPTNITINFSKDSYINYQFEIDTLPSFNTKMLQRFDYLGTSENYFAFKLLDFDQRYYWRMRGCAKTDTSNWNKTRVLKTDGMKNLSKISSDAGIDPYFTFSWSNVDSASHYQIQIDTLSSFNSPYLIDSVKMVDYKKQWQNYRAVKISQMPFGNVIYQRVRPIHPKDTGAWSKVKVSTVVAAPTTYYPFNTYTNVPIKYIFGWRAIAGVTAYRIQRDITTAFNSKSLVDTIVFTTQATLPLMKFNTTYYWRALAMHQSDTSKWSNPSKFSTQAAPVLKSPYSSKVNGPGVAGTLDWDSMPGTRIFEIWYDTSSTFSSPVLVKALTQGDSSRLNIQDLYFGKLYHWKVRAINSSDTGSWSETWLFFTYNPVRLNSPANNQKGTSFISLDWASIKGTKGYHYLLSTDSLFNKAWEGKVSKDNPFFHYFDVNPTSFNTKYFWKIRVYHAKDTTSWSAVWNFTTRPRNGVKLTFPSNNQSGVDLGAKLAWDKVSDAVTYVVELSENAEMKSSIFSVVGTNGMSTSLKPLTNYFWRVIAKNQDGILLTDSSVIFKFTSAGQFLAPTLLAPANKSTNLSTVINFSWTALAGASGYDIQIGTDSTFNVTQNNSVASNFASFGSFKTFTVYHWRIRAKNNFASGAWSNAFSFKTAAGADIDLVQGQKINLYPNPTISELYIVSHAGPIQKISIYNTQGQCLKNLVGHHSQMNLEDIPAGLYLLEVITSEGKFTQKITKR